MSWYAMKKTAGMFQPIPELERQVTGFVMDIYHGYRMLADVVSRRKSYESATDDLDKLLYGGSYRKARKGLDSFLLEKGISLDELWSIRKIPVEREFEVDLEGWKYAGLVEKDEAVDFESLGIPDSMKMFFQKRKSSEDETWSKALVMVYFDPKEPESGSSIENEIHINLAYLVSEAKVVEVCSHEVLHYSQRYLGVFGDPEVSYGTRNDRSAPDRMDQYRENYEKLKSGEMGQEEYDTEHALTPVEFYPNIFGMSKYFKTMYSAYPMGSPEMGALFRVFVGIDNPENAEGFLPEGMKAEQNSVFVNLKRKSNDLWLKAVKEFYKSLS